MKLVDLPDSFQNNSFNYLCSGANETAWSLVNNTFLLDVGTNITMAFFQILGKNCVFRIAYVKLVMRSM